MKIATVIVTCNRLELLPRALKSINKQSRPSNFVYIISNSTAENFLKEGAKVKAYVHFVGRTIVFKERGELLLLKLAQALEDIAKVDQMPKIEGKRMIIMLSPKSAKK